MVGVGRGALTARARAGLRRHSVFGALLVFAGGMVLALAGLVAGARRRLAVVMAAVHPVPGTALCVRVLEVHLLVGLA
jgi:hypothetical protein